MRWTQNVKALVVHLCINWVAASYFVATIAIFMPKLRFKSFV